jgi:hypothetical protein
MHENIFIMIYLIYIHHDRGIQMSNANLKRAMQLSLEEAERVKKEQSIPTINLFRDMTDVGKNFLSTNIDGLNNFIDKTYLRGTIAEDNIRIERSVGDIITDVCRENTADFCRWNCMFSSGNNSDCAVHSFLTATCPSFRKISQDHRNRFARAFRIHLYPDFAATRRTLASTDTDGISTTGELARIRIFTPGAFLAESDIINMFNSYKLNLLLINSGYEGEQGDINVRNPTIAVYDPKFPGEAYIVINSSNVHYESVKPGEKYTIPNAMAVNVSRRINTGGLAFNPIDVAHAAVPTLIGTSTTAQVLPRMNATNTNTNENTNENENLKRAIELSLKKGNNFDYTNLEKYTDDDLKQELDALKKLLAKLTIQAGGRKTRRKHKMRRKRKTRRA